MNEQQKKSRSDRFKQWCRNNSEELAVTGVYTAVIGTYLGLVVWAVKHDQKVADAYMEDVKGIVEQRETTVREALERGAQVLPAGGEHGGYWVIENGQTTLI